MEVAILDTIAVVSDGRYMVEVSLPVTVVSDGR